MRSQAVPRPSAKGSASSSRTEGVESAGQAVEFPASAFEEISSEEEGIEAESEGGQAVDYRSVRRLRDGSSGVDQAVFDLPYWLPGSVVVNKIAFRDQGGVQ